MKKKVLSMVNILVGVALTDIALVGLVTLGTVAGRDHSMFLMVRGTLQFLITIIFLMFYVVNIRDAKKTAEAINRGKDVPKTWNEMCASLTTDGFPYLLTFPAYILMIFTIILPVFVTLLMAFTNYDFDHIPPASLFHGSGFKTSMICLCLVPIVRRSVRSLDGR